MSSFAPAGGSGALTQINGSPSPAEAKWDISIDGGKTTIELQGVKSLTSSEITTHKS